MSALINRELEECLRREPDAEYRELLVKARHVLCMTQRAFAEFAGVKQPHLAGWESGARVCGPSVAKAIAQVLGLKEDVRDRFIYAAARTLKTHTKSADSGVLPLAMSDAVARALRRAGIKADSLDRMIYDVPGSKQSGRLGTDCFRDGMTMRGKDGSLVRVEILVGVQPAKRSPSMGVQQQGVRDIKQPINAKAIVFRRGINHD